MRSSCRGNRISFWLLRTRVVLPHMALDNIGPTTLHLQPRVQPPIASCHASGRPKVLLVPSGPHRAELVMFVPALYTGA